MWTSELNTIGALSERSFSLTVEDRTVPGVVWQPEDISGGAPLVLLGHGGNTHKKVEYLVGVAQLLVERGVVCMAIDGPGHGERADAGLQEGQMAFDRAWQDGGGTDAVVADWRAALDFVSAEVGTGPTGWWGLSMGTMMGVPVAAAEPRIQVAQLGLMGAWGINGERLMHDAPQVQCPLRFLVQWDDELVPRAACLALFGALGAKYKTLHANPGRHAEVPQFEIRESVAYLAANLTRKRA